VERCLQVVGLREEADRRPAELSLGKRKRAAMARAIVHRPKLLLLDDPTSGLDSLQAYETVALIHELRRETKAACLVASNDATRFLRAADRVAILFGGRLTSIGRPDDVVASDDPWLTEVYERLVRAETIATGGVW
jgi:ABC-type transporter Mla maintaining outer membrane lipid asymmetry ATPase subunit MlaF